MKQFIKYIALLYAFFCAPSLAFCQESVIPPMENIPRWFERAFDKNPLSKTVEISFHMNPYYLHGDFDGDGKLDVAMLVKEKLTGKSGILIFHSGTRKFYLLGAGINNWHIWSNENGGDNFDEINVWSVIRKGPVERGFEAGPPPKLKGDALLLEHSGSASGLVYWNGKEYLWYQQGE